MVQRWSAWRAARSGSPARSSSGSAAPMLARRRASGRPQRPRTARRCAHRRSADSARSKSAPGSPSDRPARTSERRRSIRPAGSRYQYGCVPPTDAAASAAALAFSTRSCGTQAVVGADRDAHVRGRVRRRGGRGAQQPLRRGIRLGLAGAQRDQHEERVAAEMPDVIVRADLAAQPPSERVAREAAGRRRLGRLDLDVDHRERAPHAARVVHELLEPVQRLGAVGEVGGRMGRGNAVLERPGAAHDDRARSFERGGIGRAPAQRDALGPLRRDARDVQLGRDELVLEHPARPLEQPPHHQAVGRARRGREHAGLRRTRARAGRRRAARPARGSRAGAVPVA